jgi:CBS domain-containing protein
MLVRVIVVLLAGVALGLSWQPYGLWPLVLIGIPAFTLAVRGVRPAAAAGLGYLFGLTMLMLAVSWLHVLGTWIAALLIVFMALFFGVLGLAVTIVSRLPWWPLATAPARAGRILGFVMIALGVLQVVTGRGLGGVWLALIGWFVVSAATAEEQQARLGGRLAGVKVGEVMAVRPTVLDGNLTVADFIAQVALTHQYSTYPLVDPHGQLTGLVTLNRVRAVPPELRATTRLQEIACPPSEVPTARPEESLVELLERMNGCADGRAVVVDDAGRVVGVVSASDVARSLQLADLRSFDPYPAPSGADLTSR